MSSASDLADLIHKLGQLDKTQIEKLISTLGSEEKPKKRGRPKKGGVQQENPQKRNGSVATGPRFNEFETLDIKNQKKEDSKIDKILNKNKSTTRQKAQNRNPKIKAKCSVCGNIVEEYAEFTWKDFETKETVCSCNRCANRRR